MLFDPKNSSNPSRCLPGYTSLQLHGEFCGAEAPSQWLKLTHDPALTSALAVVKSPEMLGWLALEESSRHWGLFTKTNDIFRTVLPSAIIAQTTALALEIQSPFSARNYNLDQTCRSLLQKFPHSGMLVGLVALCADHCQDLRVALHSEFGRDSGDNSPISMSRRLLGIEQAHQQSSSRLSLITQSEIFSRQTKGPSLIAPELIASYWQARQDFPHLPNRRILQSFVEPLTEIRKAISNGEQPLFLKWNSCNEALINLFGSAISLIRSGIKAPFETPQQHAAELKLFSSVFKELSQTIRFLEQSPNRALAGFSPRSASVYDIFIGALGTAQIAALTHQAPKTKAQGVVFKTYTDLSNELAQISAGEAGVIAGLSQALFKNGAPLTALTKTHYLATTTELASNGQISMQSLGREGIINSSADLETLWNVAMGINTTNKVDWQLPDAKLAQAKAVSAIGQYSELWLADPVLKEKFINALAYITFDADQPLETQTNATRILTETNNLAALTPEVESQISRSLNTQDPLIDEQGQNIGDAALRFIEASHTFSLGAQIPDLLKNPNRLIAAITGQGADSDKTMQHLACLAINITEGHVTLDSDPLMHAMTDLLLNTPAQRSEIIGAVFGQATLPLFVNYNTPAWQGDSKERLTEALSLHVMLAGRLEQPAFNGLKQHPAVALRGALYRSGGPALATLVA